MAQTKKMINFVDIYKSVHNNEMPEGVMAYYIGKNKTWIMDKNKDIFKLTPIQEKNVIRIEKIEWEDAPDDFWSFNKLSPEVHLYFIETYNTDPEHPADLCATVKTLEEGIGRAVDYAPDYFFNLGEPIPPHFFVKAFRNGETIMADVSYSNGKFSWMRV